MLGRLDAWMFSGGPLRGLWGLWKPSGEGSGDIWGPLEALWPLDGQRASGGTLEGLWRASGGPLEPQEGSGGLWRTSRGCLFGQESDGVYMS